MVLKDQPPAQADAPAIARMKAKGFIVIGRTNMTEFAYSGVGLNPHYGTPLSPFDRKTARIPGGSSSGAAVSVADGICALGLGTDTGGSCRIPASFCGIVGYKPSTGRIPTRGVYPCRELWIRSGPWAVPSGALRSPMQSWRRTGTEASRKGHQPASAWSSR